MTSMNDKVNPNSSESTTPSKDVFAAAREMRRHENDLINHRITWMVTFHSLLVAAVSFSWGKDAFLVVGFTVAGAIISASSGVSILIAEKSQLQIDSWWNKHASELQGKLPIAYEANRFFKLFLPWRFWPLLTLLGWLLLGYHALTVKYERSEPTNFVIQTDIEKRAEEEKRRYNERVLEKLKFDTIAAEYLKIEKDKQLSRVKK